MKRSGNHSNSSNGVQFYNPIPVRNPAPSVNIFTHFDHSQW